MKKLVHVMYFDLASTPTIVSSFGIIIFPKPLKTKT